MTRQQATVLANRIGEVLCIEDVVGEIIESIAETLSPADVFTEDQLDQWARDNDYAKE